MRLCVMGVRRTRRFYESSVQASARAERTLRSRGCQLEFYTIVVNR
jgi:hypothetical protein